VELPTWKRGKVRGRGKGGHRYSPVKVERENEAGSGAQRGEWGASVWGRCQVEEQRRGPGGRQWSGMTEVGDAAVRVG
jgi:hypothetical protein